MKCEKRKNDDMRCEMSRDEIAIIHHAMNEVCHGFKLDNFEEKIKMSKEEVKKEMAYLASLYEQAKKEGSAKVLVVRNQECISMYAASLEISCSEIEDWEFDTRFGYEKSEAMELLKTLKSI